MLKKIAIQGIQGSYHHQVAQAIFGQKIQFIHCKRFSEVAQSVASAHADFGVMALENSIAGAILPNYSLLSKHLLYIIAEYYLTISHQLLALAGQHLSQIKEIHSHPMALLQCEQFLERYPHIQLIEASDTAQAAHYVQQRGEKGIAAIASEQAASLFHLEILASNIQSIKDNFTRFVVIQRQGKAQIVPRINKASLKFEVHHQRGSLASVLNILSNCQINMTKIQSLPIAEPPWKYAFFVDITFSEYEHYNQALAQLQTVTEKLSVLGTYLGAL